MTVVSLQSEIARDVSSKLKLIQKIANCIPGTDIFSFGCRFAENCKIAYPVPKIIRVASFLKFWFVGSVLSGELKRESEKARSLERAF